jgi:hypothetical protein
MLRQSVVWHLQYTVWNTNSESSKHPNRINEIFKSLTPLFTAIKGQTGVTSPAEWTIKMPPESKNQTETSVACGDMCITSIICCIHQANNANTNNKIK